MQPSAVRVHAGRRAARRVRPAIPRWTRVCDTAHGRLLRRDAGPVLAVCEPRGHVPGEHDAVRVRAAVRPVCAVRPRYWSHAEGRDKEEGG